MKKTFTFLIMTLLGIALVQLPVSADQACGDDGTTCSEEESCYEHVIAMFAGDHSSAPPYVQGECVPKEQKQDSFWCGNRECKSGFFGSPSVCCVNQPENSHTPQYSCAFSELSCPGNSQQLTIRSNEPTRKLQRG